MLRIFIYLLLIASLGLNYVLYNESVKNLDNHTKAMQDHIRCIVRCVKWR